MSGFAVSNGTSGMARIISLTRRAFEVSSSTSWGTAGDCNRNGRTQDEVLTTGEQWKADNGREGMALRLSGAHWYGEDAIDAATRYSGSRQRQVSRTAVMFTLYALLIIGVAGQTPTSDPGRFGSLALADSELVQIRDIANGAGRNAWLVIGFRSMIAGVATVTVFLQPDAKGPEVSRGRLLVLIADDPPVVPYRSIWKIKETRSCAYVMSPGSPPFQISDERDVGWPFLVEGEIDDRLSSVWSHSFDQSHRSPTYPKVKRREKLVERQYRP